MTYDLLHTDENIDAWNELEQNIAIGGSAEASLWRFCWQAKEEKKKGKDCATGAVQWLRGCIKRRKELGMNDILASPIFDADFKQQYVKTIPFSFHGVDKAGHPILYLNFGAVDIAAFSSLWSRGEELAKAKELPTNAVVLFHLRLMEYMTKVVMAKESERQERIVDRMLGVINMEGIGRHHLSANFRAFLSAVSKDSVILFPELLHANVVLNVPGLFSAVAWPIAKQLMHPTTQAKIKVPRKADSTKELLQLIDVATLPPWFGGECSAEAFSNGGSMGAWEQSLVVSPPALPAA